MTRSVVALLRSKLQELHNVAWLLGDKAVRVIIAITVGSWVARHLGPASYGALAYAIAIASFVQMGATLGSDTLVVRDLATRPGEAGEILGTALVCRLLAGFGLWVGMVAVAQWQSGSADKPWVLLAIVSLSAVFQAGDTIDLWFQSKGQNRRAVLPKAVALVLSNGIRVTLIANDAPLVYYGLAFALDSLFSAISMGVAYRFLPAPGALKVSSSRAVALVRESAPYLAANILVTLYMRLDMLLLRHYSGDHAVGIYAAATALSTFPGFLPMLINNVSAPAIARKRLESHAGYYRALGELFRLYAGLGWLATVSLVAMAPFVVPLLYGARYSEAVLVLAIHAATNVFIFVGVAQSLWFVNEGRGASILLKAALGAALCLASGMILIPRFGAVGAAVSGVLVQFLASIAINLIIEPRMFRMQLRALVLRSAVDID